MCAKIISQIQKILYGIMLFVMVIATTGARVAPPYKLGSNEQSLDLNEMGEQFLQPISFEQEIDSAPEMVNINSSYALKMDILDKVRIPVKSSTESGHAVQWRREATLVREL